MIMHQDMSMNSCGILSPILLATDSAFLGTVCREIGALRFVASTTIVAFPGLLQVGFLNFFCTSRWVSMRMRKSLSLPISTHGWGEPFRSEARSCKTVSRRSSEARSN